MVSYLPLLATTLLIAQTIVVAGCAGSARQRSSPLAHSGALAHSEPIAINAPRFPTADSESQAQIRLASFGTLQEDANPEAAQNAQDDSTTIEVVDPIHRLPTSTSSPTQEFSQGAMTLADFESMALVNNPTIAQMVATTQKAAGFRTQVGLRANPFVGYNGTQIADAGTDQHTAIISQTIITADKLELNRRVLNEALRSQLLELEAQKYRVATDVRVKFFEALAIQQQQKLIGDFQTIANKGVELANLRKNAGEGSQLEVVQAKVQQNEIDLALQQAQANFDGAWRELVALVGSPGMLPATLHGALPTSDVDVDWNGLAASILQASPEYCAAEVRVAQARANLQRQCVQPIPNLNVSFGAGVDNGTNSGLMNLQVGAPLPVFNQNQGNIAAARAELTRAARDVARIENSIKARVGAVSGDYNASLVAVNKYAVDILPNAQEGLKLAEIAYKAGETSFVQVLVARRTYFDSNLQFLKSQTLLAQSRALVDGYVLTGSLAALTDNSGDSSLRDLTLGQE